MKEIKKVALLFGLTLFILNNLFGQVNQQKNDDYKNTLWYTQPAKIWTEALPIGNGRLGAMIFGRTANELLQLNEESVWVGPPVPEPREGAFKYIQESRKLIFAGQYLAASKLMQDNVMSPVIQKVSYQTLGNLKLDFKLTGEAENYKRELNIESAISKTSFTVNGVNFTREYLSSSVDGVIAVKLTASQAKSITLELSLDRPADFQVTTSGNNKLRMWGQAGQNGKQLGVKYETQLMAIPQGGKMEAINGKIKITNANSVVLLLAAVTDYNKKAPLDPLTRNLANTCADQLQKSSKKSINKLIDDHVKEYQSIFNRVDINLGNSLADTKPTNERLEAVKNGADDPGLFALYFQYGRYLLISSSRAGNLPANLQGIWNEHMTAPWNSDYHTNINFQMNYWPAEVTNLSECHQPFFDFVEELVPSGKKTAKAVYNSDGFVVHHTTDVWHWTAPSGRLGYAMWPFGGAWSTQHFMEHYRFTEDKTFLKERAYPIMKSSCEFLLNLLTEDPRSGKLVSGPSTSPENRFYPPNETKEYVTIDMGNAMDQEIIWDSFTNLLEAAKVLKIEDDFVNKIKIALTKLALPKVGSDGRLMEWSQEFNEVDPGHRHLSHLFGLYPGNQFNATATPWIIDAINKSIDYRLANGGGHTGWSRAWIINFYARLKSKEKAYSNLKALLQKSTALNLFDFHPPFQIDGNFGGTAGIAEMLLQTNLKDQEGNFILELLPTLPVEWPMGNVKGLCARGGFEVDMEWEKGHLKSATISSKIGGKCKIKVDGKETSLTLAQGEKRTLSNF